MSPRIEGSSSSMIVWPRESALGEDGLRGLEAFHDTSAVAELEGSPDRWRVVGWPWNDEAPTRVIVENDAHHTLVFTLDEDGVWTLAPVPLDVHERTPGDLEADALALVHEP